MAFLIGFWMGELKKRKKLLLEYVEIYNPSNSKGN